MTKSHNQIVSYPIACEPLLIAAGDALENLGAMKIVVWMKALKILFTLGGMVTMSMNVPADL